MKKLLLLFVILIIGNNLHAQVSEILQQTWHLRNLKIDNIWHYMPYGETIELNFEGNDPNYTLHSNGIQNTFTANAHFNEDNLLLTSIQISSSNCTAINCDFEDLYFYEVLSNVGLDDKTFTYLYSVHATGMKSLKITDADGNRAEFRNQPVTEIDDTLFQTWYLHSMDADLGDTEFISDYVPPISPTLTINPDLSFTGFGSCNEFSGGFDYTDYPSGATMLLPKNLETAGNNCQFHIEFENYYFSQFEVGPLYFWVGGNPSNGEASFAFEMFPGFTFHFFNYPVLSVTAVEKNSFSAYPNPAQDKLFIKSTIDNISILIRDINGRTVFKEENLNSNEIDISTLNSGMYFISIVSSEGNITKKFLKN